MYYIINKEDIQYSRINEAYVSLNTPYNIQWGPWVLFFIDKDDNIFLTVFSTCIMTTNERCNTDKQLGVFMTTENLKRTCDGLPKSLTGIMSTSYWCEINDKGTVLNLELNKDHEYLKYLKQLVLVPIKELPSILVGTNGSNEVKIKL